MNIVVDGHTHSVASGHAYSTIDENARYASKIGLSMIGLTDHAPGMHNTTGRAYFTNFHILPHELYGVKLLHGAELNIMDFQGTVDLEQELLQEMDIAIASLHPPCIKSGSTLENTRAVISAMENPYVDILGHPGDPRYPIDISAVFKAANETGTLLEINNQSLQPGGFRCGSDVILRELLSLSMEHGTPVVLGSDAHFYNQIGDMSCCERLLDLLQFPDALILNTDIALFMNSLKRNQRAADKI